VVRFTNVEVLQEFPSVLDTVARLVTPSPRVRGEGGGEGCPSP
jgi:hypothetical protein